MTKDDENIRNRTASEPDGEYPQDVRQPGICGKSGCREEVSSVRRYVKLVSLLIAAVFLSVNGYARDTRTVKAASVLQGDADKAASAADETAPAADGAVSDADGADASKAQSFAVNFERVLDSYQPKKNHYNFFFTYKNVHAWWDAVALGIEEAQRQYLARGITVTYEYLAPKAASVFAQERFLRQGENGDYDVIGVDVADESISMILDELSDEGHKVMTFSSSDAAEGCKRIAYVGNTHNYEDGARITEALCEKLGYQGKIAVLIGTQGAPCHEERAQGARAVIAKYEDMKIVDVGYDQDSVDRAYKMTEKFLKRFDDLAGIVCCNMSNPVGAVRALTDMNRNDVVVVGMDHDQEALQYVRDGKIYCLGVQDCFSIGFDTIQVAVRIADGVQPGDLYPEKTEEDTTLIYQDEAGKMLEILYGEVR